LEHTSSNSCKQDSKPAKVPAARIREAAARLVADRVRQGLPARIEDPVVLARIASILKTLPLRSEDHTVEA
jgi:hypothetical protein